MFIKMHKKYRKCAWKSTSDSGIKVVGKIVFVVFLFTSSFVCLRVNQLEKKGAA